MLARPVLIAALLFAPSLALARSPLETIKREAKRAEKAGDQEAAERAYARLAFAGSRSALKKLRALQSERATPSFEEAADLARRDAEAALAALVRAAEIAPHDARVAKLYKKLDHTFVGGRWVPADRAEAARKEDARLGATRRAALGLGEAFSIIREGPFRFYTDIDMKYGRSVLEQMFTAIQAHYVEYLRVMEPLGVRYPAEGLDVVLFQRESDYLKHTGVPGSAGVYFPSKGAGFFFAGSAGFNFPTMLHEMTHQLNHKVLGAVRATPWFEEGIAEYFGAGLLSAGCRRIQLGVPERGRMSDFRGMQLAGRTYPLAQYFGASAQLSGAYYAQAWALTYFLMEGSPVGRLIVFDLIASSKAKGQNVTLSDAEVERVLAEHGLTVDALERAYLAFHRGEKAGAASTLATRFESRR